MKESARKPLPGSMPTVASVAEAKGLVATQDENPDLDLSDLPFEEHEQLERVRRDEDSVDCAAAAGL